MENQLINKVGDVLRAGVRPEVQIREVILLCTILYVLSTTWYRHLGYHPYFQEEIQLW